MAPSEVSRRAFLGTVAGGLTTMTAMNWRVLANQRPNDQIVLGMIGVGGMGTGRLRQFLSHPDVRIGAICDVDRAHADRAVAEVEKAGGQKPKVFGDFRRVLTDPEIDAVAVVTPDHWHALATVRAFEAGKDVFVEKPLSYSVAEGRMMADGSLKYKRVTQMGNHIHNDLPNYRRVVELVQSGKLGRITRAHCWKTGGGGGGGRAGGAGRGGARPPDPRRYRRRWTTISGSDRPRTGRTIRCVRTARSGGGGTTQAGRSSTSGRTSST